MPDDGFDPDAYLEHASRLLDLPIDPAHRAGVIQYLLLARAIAAPMLAFPLPEEVEAAPVFEP